MQNKGWAWAGNTWHVDRERTIIQFSTAAELCVCVSLYVRKPEDSLGCRPSGLCCVVFVCLETGSLTGLELVKQLGSRPANPRILMPPPPQHTHLPSMHRYTQRFKIWGLRLKLRFYKPCTLPRGLFFQPYGTFARYLLVFSILFLSKMWEACKKNKCLSLWLLPSQKLQENKILFITEFLSPITCAGLSIG